MIDGRFASLGLAVYKTLQAPPNHSAFKGLPVHAWLYNGLKGIKPYLEEELQIMRKDADNWGPEIQQGRQMNLDQLKEEIRWTTDAIERIRELEREKGFGAMSDQEIADFEKKQK